MIVSPPPNRSIRFAPLPDPRRSVLVSDDGRETPFSPNQLSPESPQFNRAETPILSPTKIPAAVSIAATGSFSKKSSMFKGFTSSDTSSSSSSTSESVETPCLTRTSSTSSLGGTQTPTQSKLMNLFRTTSRGDATPQPSWGHTLQRWTSGGSNASSTNSTVSAPAGGVPMRRTMSTQSAKSKNNKSLLGFITKSKQERRGSTASDGNGMLATVHNSSPQSRKGTRMLNGRIYGARRNPNPFANAQDDPDPEFVEWGYGGMGSVRHGAGVGGRVWGKLMSNDTTYAESPKGLGDDDMDDGSGMGWVRRRREQRELEKAAKETERKEERAEAEKESQRKELSSEEPQSSPESTSSAPPALGSLPSPPPQSILSPSKPSTPASQRPLGTPITSPVLVSPPALSPQQSYGSHPGSTVASPSTDDEHLTRAVNIPAPRLRHYHGHHKRDSVHHLADATEEADNAHLQDSEKQPPEEAEDDTLKTARQSSMSSISSTSTSSTSTSGSETESGSDSDSESEDEDDEDDEQSREARKTSLGAGVEKISRHKT